MTSRRRPKKPQVHRHGILGRPVLVTGASRGIGAETAVTFARAGHPVILVARDKVALASVAKSIESGGGVAHVMPADLSGTEAATRFAAKLLEAHPDICGAVLNAGLAVEGAVTSRDPDSFLSEFDVNYFAPVALARMLLRHWQGDPLRPSQAGHRAESGSIVAVSSLTATVPFPGHANYGASKAALNQMMRNLRVEIAMARQRTGGKQSMPIHIGIVSPGYTQTAMTEGLDSSLPGSAPSFIAAAIWDCFDRRLEEVVPGIDNKVAAGIFRLLPSVADKFLQAGSHWLVPGKSTRRPRKGKD
ncbi:MAG: hypothetical protein RIQ81_382 [Pseudomonadota bacterium]